MREVLMPGLMWLNEPRYDSFPICLTFVRGTEDKAVFTAFGADPDEAGGPPRGVLVTRSRGWLVLIEDAIPPQGVRPEVLRRASAGGEAVSFYQDIGKGNHEFGHAANGEILAMLTTAFPPCWSGRSPERLAARARELGLDGGLSGDDLEPDENLTPWEIVLRLAGETFGLSLDEADLERAQQAASGAPERAESLPLLKDLPPEPSGPLGIGDPVIDLLVNHATQEDLRAVLSVRTRRILSEPGLSGYRDLPAAVAHALGDGKYPPPDDHQAELTLRKLTRDQERAELDLAAGRSKPDFSEPESRERVRLGNLAFVLRLILAGRLRQALVTDLLFKRRHHPHTWREQAIGDLAAVRVPAAEMAAAEQTWEATRHLPPATEPVGTQVVRDHIQRLLDSGMDKSRIAELAGMTTVGIDLMLSGRIPVITGYNARRILTIEPLRPSLV